MSSQQHDGGNGTVGSGGERAGPSGVSQVEVLRQGDRAAATLTRLGVAPGEPVAVLLPMCLDSVVATLACLRTGALRRSLPVEQGSPGALRHALRGVGARVVITAGCCRTGAATVDVKARLDRALVGCPGVSVVLVVPLVPRPVPWVPGRDLWWHEALADDSLPPRPHAGEPVGGSRTLGA